MIVHDVEQGSEEWHGLRAGMPTASEFSKLITSTGEPSKSMLAYAQKLAGDTYAGKDIDAWEGNKYTERGHEIEHEARLAYAMRGKEIDEVGFCTDDQVLWGCSPDGMVEGEMGLLEIKCLPKKHIGVLLYWDKHKKTPPDYIAQTQGQMLITGAEWCDLMFYHPELPSLVIRQEPDKKIQQGLIDQRDACLEERERVLKILEGL